MNDPLYAKDVLRLAAAATGAGRLDPCDAHAQRHNPSCGDRIFVTLKLDEKGLVAALAHETQACVLTQASAALLGARLAGCGPEDVARLRDEVAKMLQGGAVPAAPFAGYSALLGATSHRNRHTCVLLPIDAVLDAMTVR